jgi:hypothetical protein
MSETVVADHDAALGLAIQGAYVASIFWLTRRGLRPLHDLRGFFVSTLGCYGFARAWFALSPPGTTFAFWSTFGVMGVVAVGICAATEHFVRV